MTLLWACELAKINEAYELERKLHGWSRLKKLALARGDFAQLPALASRSYAGQELWRALRDGP